MNFKQFLTKKNIFLAVVSLVSISGMITVLYNGFLVEKTPPPKKSLPANLPPPLSSNKNTTANKPTSKSAPVIREGSSKILPFGSAMDLGPIKEYNPQQQKFPYPKVQQEDFRDPEGSIDGIINQKQEQE